MLGRGSMMPIAVVPPVIPVTIVAVVVSVTPVRSVMTIVTVTIPVIRPAVVVWIGSVVRRSIKNRERNRRKWQTKGKINACARRRHREKRQPRDD